MTHQSAQRRADGLLTLVTAFWGVSYYLSDLCMRTMSPMNLNAFRFLCAFVVLGTVFHRRVLHASRRTLMYSGVIGLALTATYVLYGYGQPLTSISNAGFICGLPVIWTPILGFIFLRRVPGKRFLVALVICVAGIALLTLKDDLTFGLGDIILMGVPVCYSADLLLTEQAISHDDVDPLALGVLKLGVVGGVTLLLSLLFEQPHLPGDTATWAAALFLGVFCSGIAFVVQSTQQKHTTAAHAGLIFTLEPVFAALAAWLLAGERMSARGLIGAGLMLLSLFIIELDSADG